MHDKLFTRPKNALLKFFIVLILFGRFGHSNNSYGDDISSDSPVVDSPSPLLIGGLSEENGSITTTTQNNEFADNLYESGPST